MNYGQGTQATPEPSPTVMTLAVELHKSAIELLDQTQRIKGYVTGESEVAAQDKETQFGNVIQQLSVIKFKLQEAVMCNNRSLQGLGV